MSINRLVMIVVVAGYLLVNITMQTDFFGWRTITTVYAAAALALLLSYLCLRHRSLTGRKPPTRTSPSPRP